MTRPIYILTGATAGMGLHIAAHLREKTGARLLVGARRPAQADHLKALAPEAEVFSLDLASLASVAAFAATVAERLGDERPAGIICNAGLQLAGPPRLTPDGVDESFAVNYLGHFALVEHLLPRLAPGGVVVTIGSGTHNPADPLARLFGFRGADFPDAARVAAGTIGRQDQPKRAGMDRYATGKLCAILHMLDMAGRIAPAEARFYAFDPGLMPGTDLARARSAPERFAWRHLLPWLRYLVAGVSSAEASAAALVEHLVLAPEAHPSGAYVEFTGRLAPHDALARRADLALALRAASLRLIGT